jgi:glucan phosphoethanolaminetransferase (alkaline phosphatase superfamily)
MTGGRFWRNLAYAEYPLNTVQKIGVTVLLFTSGLPFIVFLGAQSMVHALSKTGPRESAPYLGIDALLVLLWQILMIVIMFRVLVSAFRPKKPQDDLRLQVRRSSKFL